MLGLECLPFRVLQCTHRDELLMKQLLLLCSSSNVKQEKQRKCGLNVNLWNYRTKAVMEVCLIFLMSGELQKKDKGSGTSPTDKPAVKSGRSHYSVHISIVNQWSEIMTPKTQRLAQVPHSKRSGAMGHTHWCLLVYCDLLRDSEPQRNILLKKKI